MINRNGRVKRVFAAALASLMLAALLPSLSGVASAAHINVADPATFCANAGTSSFTDTGSLTADQKKAIDCIVELKVTTGTGDGTTYSPAANVTREQMALFITRLFDALVGLAASGKTPTAIPAYDGTNAFGDVSDTATGVQAINRLARAGIANGTKAAEGTEKAEYSPAAPVSREQMAAFMARAQAFVFGSWNPGTTDYFDDDAGRSLEPSINAIAAGGVTAGVGGRVYDPTGLVTRLQMALFLARIGASNLSLGNVTAIPAKTPATSGTVVAVNKTTNTYTYVNSAGTSVNQTWKTTGEQFFVDGTAATEAVFESNITNGDKIEYVAAAGTTPAQHKLTNVTNVTDGTVAAADSSANTFIIGDAFGNRFNTYTYGSGTVYTLDGNAATQIDINNNISAGDSVKVTLNSSNAVTKVELTNAALTGTMKNFSGVSPSAALSFNIGLFGDNPVTSQNTVMDVVSGSAIQKLSIAGTTSTYQAFQAAASNGDEVTYSRAGGVESFDIVNKAPTPISGIATDASTTGTVVIAIPGVSPTVTTTNSTATQFLIDGVLGTMTDAAAALRTPLNAGDSVKYTPADPGTNTKEKLEITSGLPTGGVADLTKGTSSDNAGTFDIVNSKGAIIDDAVSYAGGATSAGAVIWQINGTTTTNEAQFEAALEGLQSGLKTGNVALSLSGTKLVVNVTTN